VSDVYVVLVADDPGSDFGVLRVFATRESAANYCNTGLGSWQYDEANDEWCRPWRIMWIEEHEVRGSAATSPESPGR